ncbi:MAG: ABC transporter ATP-binding protein, partial [Candidatus Hodarchaeales archaeon]
MMFVSVTVSYLVNSLVFSGLILIISIFLSRLINSIIPYTKRISEDILLKSNLIAAAISYGIWTGQFFILGLGLGFFIPLIWHIILVGLFFVINWIFTKKIIREETKKSLVGLKDRLKEKEEERKRIEEGSKKEKILLDVQDLVTYFYTEEGIVRAVEGVTFQIYEDEVLGLVGETGCGKSVTALSILQLIRPPGETVGGKVRFQGVDLLKLSGEEIRNYRGDQITMIFQDPLNSLNPVMKVGDQIIEVYLNHKMDELYAEAGTSALKTDVIRADLVSKKEIMDLIREKIIKIESEEPNIKDSSKNLETIELDEDELLSLLSEEKVLKEELKEIKKDINVFAIARKWAAKVIKDVGIADPDAILDRYPHELSGGMRQRVMIAIALSCSPKLLIADEPTTALDVTIQAQILELMKRLQNDFQTSILMITHDLGLISEICDRVAVMYSGYIVEYGSIFQLFKKP